jgi:hypothetical protein
MVAIGWPLMQVFYSWLIGWPIAKRFERGNMVIVGSRPSKQYFIGGLINAIILGVVTWTVFNYGTRMFFYGAALGTLLIFLRAIGGTRQAAVEAYQMIYPKLSSSGKLLADDDLRRHGITLPQE